MSAAIQMLIAGTAQTILGLALGEGSQISFHTNGLLAFFYLYFSDHSLVTVHTFMQ